MSTSDAKIRIRRRAQYRSLVIVSAEFVGAKSGLGYLIWTSWQVFQVEKMCVGLAVIALVGVAIAVLLNELERWLIPWRRT